MAQGNGEFSYKLIVDAKSGIKNLADFAKGAGQDYPARREKQASGQGERQA